MLVVVVATDCTDNSLGARDEARSSWPLLEAERDRDPELLKRDERRRLGFLLVKEAMPVRHESQHESRSHDLRTPQQSRRQTHHRL